jgi:hypothetical protein
MLITFALQSCPPPETPIIITLTTTRKTSTSTRKTSTTAKSSNQTKSSSTRRVSSTSTKVPTPSRTHATCGGGRANSPSCRDGFACIKDPYRPGCGPECDGPGICVQDTPCGGFAGTECATKGQVCVDDPRDGDDCDPKLGAADCFGLCVWPH